MLISRLCLTLMLATTSTLALAKSEPADAMHSASTADHTKFEELQQKFATAPDVTKACLTCHTEASKQIHKTIHWNWSIIHPETGQTLGKAKVINSFCGSITTNYARREPQRFLYAGA
jgi:hypothetical protein